MPHRWPEDVAFTRLELEVEVRACPHCKRKMHLCDHRHRRIFTLDGPCHIVSKLAHCPDKDCPGHHKTYASEAESRIALPWWAVGWDVFAYVGHRRFARHWSVPQIRAELADTHRIDLSDDAIERYVRKYQTMVAARHQAPELLAEAYAAVDDLILSIDGLQPEKGHETLYVVRELRCKRVWFAESLLSSAEAEVRGLFEQAKAWAERLDRPVCAWVSDKQDAFVKGVASVFPGVPHRYCRNHFVRDVAKPVLEADSAAKVRMRRKVRGLRAIEREVLDERREAAQALPDGRTEDPAKDDTAGEVTIEYCAAVRGILNDNQGGPLAPSGLRMADALGEVRESIQRNLDVKKGGPRRSASRGSRAVSTAGSRRSNPSRRNSADT